MHRPIVFCLVMLFGSAGFPRGATAQEDECTFATPAVEDRLFGKTFEFRSYTLVQKGSEMTEKAITKEKQHFEIAHNGCDSVSTTVKVYLRGKSFDETLSKKYFRRSLASLKKQTWNKDESGELVTPLRFILQDLEAATKKNDLGSNFSAGDEAYSVEGSVAASSKRGFAVEVTLIYSLGGVFL